jgi:hypothetical protein
MYNSRTELGHIKHRRGLHVAHECESDMLVIHYSAVT